MDTFASVIIAARPGRTLGRSGLISDSFLREYRRYAYVLILIVAAVVTPPDVISQIIVSIPLILLYEGSIIVAKVITKRNLKKERKANAATP